MVSESRQRLDRSGDINAAKQQDLCNSKTEVEANSIGVVLHGQVNLFYYKQLAQELVRNELKDIPIFNEIEVLDPR